MKVCFSYETEILCREELKRKCSRHLLKAIRKQALFIKKWSKYCAFVFRGPEGKVKRENGKKRFLFVSLVLFCFVFFCSFLSFSSNILSFRIRRPKTKLFYSYSRHFWLAYLAVAFAKSVHFVFLRWFKLHMVCNNYLKRSSRMLGDSVVSSFFPLSEAGLENNSWNWVPHLKHNLFAFYFHYSSVQGEETLMVERESKAHCLSHLADEKWQVSFSYLLNVVCWIIFLTDNCCHLHLYRRLAATSAFVHTTPEEFENTALFLLLGLPSSLIRHKTVLFDNALQTQGIWKSRLCVLTWCKRKTFCKQSFW